MSTSSDELENGLGSTEAFLPSPETSSPLYTTHSSDSKHRHSFFSVISLHWLNSLVWKGFRHPLQLEDLDLLPYSYASSSLTSKMDRILLWEQSEAAIKQRPFSLLKVLWSFIGLHWAFSGFYKLISDICTLTTPLVLSFLILQVKLALEQNENFRSALALCFALLALMTVASFSVNYYFQLATLDGLKIKTALNGAIYAKLFRLSEASKLKFSSGMLVNLVSVDTTKIEALTGYLHYIWSGIFQITIILALLISSLGWAAFAGMAVMLISIPYHRFSIRQLSQLRKANTNFTDNRVQTIQEALQIIRCIKAYCWERWILSKVATLREKELQNLQRLQIYRGLLQAFAMAIPLFSAIVTFGVYRWLGHTLSPEIVFPALAYFNLIRLPLMLYPAVISMLIDAKVSTKRLEDFFNAEEAYFSPSMLSPNSINSVEMKDASFSWTIQPNSQNSPQNTFTSKKKESKVKGGIEEDSKNYDSKTIFKDLENNTSAIDSKNVKKSSELPSNTFTQESFCLKDLNLEIKKGQFVVIIGPVGSGKTSLLSALVGEMKYNSGYVGVAGPLGYCAQQAWIQNTTIRQNILFGLEFNESRYSSTLVACALLKDLESFSHGDLTEIGEKGITLSGGQKQRIALARMIYSQQQIVLMDDPLSAVDRHVGLWIYQHCIKGHPEMTRILVTHQLWLVEDADWIIAMDNGCIAYQGTYSKLLLDEPKFYVLMKEHNLLKTDKPKTNDNLNNTDFDGFIQNSSHTIKSDQIDQEASNFTVLDKEVPFKALPPGGSVPLMQIEERAVGSVAYQVYKEYILASGGIFYLCFVLLSLVFLQLSRVLTDMWLSYYTKATTHGTMKVFMTTYCVLGVCQVIGSLLFSLSCSYGGVRAGKRLFYDAFCTILSGRVSFFDTTPLGRILNRFTKDLDGVDLNLSETLRSFILTLAMVFSSLILMAVITPVILPLFVCLVLIYYFVQLVYRSNSRELKRLDAITKSPLLAHFSESLLGLSTIRASHAFPLFSDRNYKFIDTTNRPQYYQLLLQRWLAIRLETISNLILFSIAVASLLFSVEPSLFGLLVAYALSLNGILTWSVRQAADTEVQMNAVERLVYYQSQNISTEAVLADSKNNEKIISEILNRKANENIPFFGSSLVKTPIDYTHPYALEFRNMSLRYRPELPLSLCDISFYVFPGERVGIVGRTGSGKSSLFASLCRFVAIEASSSILYYGTSISDIPLPQLRQDCFTFILQDPMFLHSTVRQNLDPYNMATDCEIWDVLSQVRLDTFLRDHYPSSLLTTKMSSDGDPFSLGQCQLLSLARALLKLRKSSHGILIMDEATANIDMTTDTFIQSTLTEMFSNSSNLPSDIDSSEKSNITNSNSWKISPQNKWTILTIAHRLQTVLDYDRIVVLDQGKVVELGPPKSLLADPSSYFYHLFHSS